MNRVNNIENQLLNVSERYYSNADTCIGFQPGFHYWERLDQYAFFEFSCASVSKRVSVRNLSHNNDFCIQLHFLANQSYFHKNGFQLRLALKQRRK